MKKRSAIFIFSILPCFLFSQSDSIPPDIPPDTALAADSTVNENSASFPVFSATSGDLNDELGSQDISSILQSSKDVFTATAGFNFGPARFRIRGYEPENTAVLINGISMNDPENGYASFSSWGGLNDVTRYMEVRTGLSASRITFGGIGGYSNIDTRATSFRKGTRISYALSNRNYTHRFMLTAATGLMENGWAVAFSRSRRWADEGFTEGTFFDGWSYLLSIEKKFNDSHSMNFSGFGAPTIQGKQSVATQEAYNLAGTNFYNSYWGYQDGKKRNSRISNSHRPLMVLTHHWTLNEKSEINTSAFFSKGRNGITGLNWYDARDPRPDYYRYLPSYYESTDENKFAELTDLWKNEVNTRQVDWDNLYFANMKNLYTLKNADGVTGNNITGNRSKYILEEYRNDQAYYGVNSNASFSVTDKLNISGGMQVKIFSDHYYKLMNDLLGGDFWVDVDQFAERDFADPRVAQNDLQIPNRVIRTGDKFGYDYFINVKKYEGFAQAEWILKHFDFYFGATASSTTFWRDGNMQNGRFPDNSFGNSEKKDFSDYGMKSGLVYKISGRHYVSVNSAYLTRAPLPGAAFVSQKTRNDYLPGLTNETLSSSDLNYIVRYKKFKSRATFYYTEIKNQVWYKSFYHDDYRTFVNYFMTGVDNLHYGGELGMEANVTSSVSVSGVLAKGDFIYDSRPTATISRDNSSEILAENRTIYLKNYKVGGKPQTAASLGIKYSSSKAWFAGINANYFDDIYVDINPDRRTEEALQKFVITDPQWDEILQQQKLPSSYTVDFYAGKSFRIKNYFFNINLSVNNVLDNEEFCPGGFEQLRYDTGNIDKFSPKYSYYYGTTYYLMVNFRF